jgi:hypothetical protein
MWWWLLVIANAMNPVYNWSWEAQNVFFFCLILLFTRVLPRTYRNYYTVCSRHIFVIHNKWEVYAAYKINCYWAVPTFIFHFRFHFSLLLLLILILLRFCNLKELDSTRPGRRLSLQKFSLFSSAHPTICLSTTSIKPRLLPSKPFPIHYSLVILPFDVTYSRN